MYVIVQKNILSLPGGTILMDLCICIYMPTLSIIFAYIKSHDPNYYVSVCMYVCIHSHNQCNIVSGRAC